MDEEAEPESEAGHDPKEDQSQATGNDEGRTGVLRVVKPNTMQSYHKTNLGCGFDGINNTFFIGRATIASTEAYWHVAVNDSVLPRQACTSLTASNCNP